MTDFNAIVEARAKGGGIAIRLPFDPSTEWGEKDRHDVTGTVAGCKVRGKIQSRDGDHFLEMGPAWCRDNPVAVGANVPVTLGPEGPRIGVFAADIGVALAAEADARRFFEALPTFYRKNFVRWIES